MPSQPEILLSRQILNKIASYRYALLLFGILLLAIFFRCLHLLNANYFIISADSYYFHWLAGRITTGEGLPADAPPGALYTLHTGLTYPIVYFGKALSYIFGISPDNAINISALLIPLLLGIISLLVIYFAGSRICNRKAGLFSALTWALVILAVLIGGAGYIDRDGLSVLLVMTGAFVFYFTEYLHIRIGVRDFGWLAGAIVVITIEVLLYLEWTYPGPVLLLAIIGAYVLGRMLIEYLNYIRITPNSIRGLKVAFNKINWRTFTIILGVNILFFLLNPNTEIWTRFMVETIGSGGESGVAEMVGIGPNDLLMYHLFLIPIILGFYLAWKNKHSGAVFFASWLIGLLILGLFSKRVMIYAVPAICLLSGIGFAYLWDWQKRGKSQDWKKIGVSALLSLILLLAFIFTYVELSNPAVAANEDWQDALDYLREQTPKESVVMTNWGWGYWILDLGQRRPVVDNGFYYYNDEKLNDIGKAYVATEASEAVQIMEKYDADYLIFSQIDLNSQPIILRWAGLDKRYKEFPDDSLAVRVLNGEFEAEDDLRVVYRSTPNEGVIILALTRAE